MRTRLLLLPAAASVLLAGCVDGPTQPRMQCELNVTPSLSISGDTVRTGTGLKYIETQAGTGAQVQPGLPARVCYVGFLPDGKVFDSGSIDFVPGSGRVIAGFDQGVVGMRVLGTRRLIIPPNLGYGSQPVNDPVTGQVAIPANSTLVYDVGIIAAARP